MRTTLTLDEDVAGELAEVSRQTRQPFKVVVNDALRRGLRDRLPPEPPFELTPKAGHLRPGIDDRKLNELAWELENDEGRRR